MNKVVILVFLLMFGCASHLEYICTDKKELKRFTDSEIRSGSRIVKVDTLRNSNMIAYRVVYKLNK